MKQGLKSISSATMVVAVIATLASCGLSTPDTVSAQLSLRTNDAATAPETAQTEQIIAKRLEAFLPRFGSKLKSEVVGHTIRFDFYGTPPDKETALYLAMTRGELRISLATLPSDVWISEADVEDARLMNADQDEPSIEIWVNEAAAQRMLAHSRDNLGRLLRISWEGQLLTTARLESLISDQMQFPAPAPPRGVMMRVILQHGPLPVPIAAADYREGA